MPQESDRSVDPEMTPQDAAPSPSKPSTSGNGSTESKAANGPSPEAADAETPSPAGPTTPEPPAPSATEPGAGGNATGAAPGASPPQQAPEAAPAEANEAAAADAPAEASEAATAEASVAATEAAPTDAPVEAAEGAAADAPAEASEAATAEASVAATEAAPADAPVEATGAGAPAPAAAAAAATPGSPAAAEGEAPAPESKPALKVGDRLRGRVVSIADPHTTLDCADHGEARIATAELRDRQGEVLLRVDDKLTGTVSSIDDGILLTLGKKRGVLDAARLRLALENRTPVKGTVQNLNKGGFEVRIGRVRAFCPLSQIDASFVDNPQSYLGKSMTFRVLRWESHGRNIVVSRRSILREEAKRLAQETRKHLTEGAEVEGVVKRLQSFGAFIDLGGLEGLLHVSRMSHTRIDDPTQVVKLGDTVRVRVVKIEHPGTRRERIALALADLGPDPWEAVPEQIHVGDVLTGTVARLAPFGAFVHLPQGVDGLVHVSELAPTRVQEPKEVVSPGQEVQVKVLHVDLEKRRISLSLRRASETESSPPKKREPRRERPARGREKPAPAPGPGGVSLTHTMAEQLGHLKQKLGGRR